MHGNTAHRCPASFNAAGSMSDLAWDTAYVLSGLDGRIRHPERFSRTFRARLVGAQKALSVELLATIRLHDLRHTHATLLLKAGEPVKVVLERLGHASAMITLGVYTHTLPGMQRDAANRLAALVLGT